MASFAYNKFKTRLLKGDVDLDEGLDDVRVLLVSAITTADTEDDTEFIAGFTTLDEVVATGYARQALANQLVNEDLANNRAEFDADDAAFGALGNGANDTIDGAVVFKFVTNDADSPVMCHIDTGGFPKTTNGGTFTVQWNAEGILQTT